MANLPLQQWRETGRAGGHRPRSWWLSPVDLVTLGFLAVGGFFLITEHTAHVFGALPWLLLAACPLMHVFMHHGHHSGGHDHSSGGARPLRDRRKSHDP
jgi:hypothetical protein